MPNGNQVGFNLRERDGVHVVAFQGPEGKRFRKITKKLTLQEAMGEVKPISMLGRMLDCLAQTIQHDPSIQA